MTNFLSNKTINILNDQIKGKSPDAILKWSVDQFPGNLFAMSSFGADSAIMFKLIENADLNIPILTVDTGFWFEETYLFMDELVSRHNLKVTVCRPSDKDIKFIKEHELWSKDIEKYQMMTKVNPLKRAIRELGISALISGVRKEQTPNRASLTNIDTGLLGETRIHPILDWPKEEADAFIEQYRLLRHPLYWQGYESVGDYTTTRQGTGRVGRSALGKRLECGIHLKK